MYCSPYPEEGLEFTTMFCRMVNASADSVVLSLRDYSQPLLDIRDINISGRLIGAEEVAAPRGWSSFITSYGGHKIIILKIGFCL